MTSVATPTILSAGRAIDPSYRLASLDVQKEVDRVPTARLVLLDGSPAERTFPTSDADFFEPGKDIEIKMRRAGEEDVSLFKGVVVRHGLEATIDGSALTVVIKDPSFKLTQTRKSAVFRDLSDAEVITQIIEDAGLEAGDIPPTEPTHQSLIQYNATDWDFLLSRSDVQGLVILADQGVVSAIPMKLNGSPVATIEYGITEIYDLDLEINGSTQLSSLTSVGWDIQKQSLSEPSEAETVSIAQGNMEGADLADGLGFAAPALRHAVPVETTELQAWADARLARSRLALVRGRLSLPGFTGINLMEAVELNGMGERFNGQALVTGVRHQLSLDGWKTDLQLGLSADHFCDRSRINGALSAGLLPAISGLHVGVVSEFEDDPAGEHRVKIVIPSINPDEAVFARLTTPDAGAGRGFLFRPEPKDEVVVGFFGNDPRHPVILGAMFGSKNTPAEAVGSPEEKNLKKGIVTAKGTSITFIDDEKAKVTIETAGGNSVMIDDENESISLRDQHGNKVAMSSDGIKLQSAADFIVEASGDVMIKGSSVDIQ